MNLGIEVKLVWLQSNYGEAEAALTNLVGESPVFTGIMGLDIDGDCVRALVKL